MDAVPGENTAACLWEDNMDNAASASEVDTCLRTAESASSSLPDQYFARCDYSRGKQLVAKGARLPLKLRIWLSSNVLYPFVLVAPPRGAVLYSL